MKVKILKKKRCKGCGNEFQPVRPLQQVCSPLCAIKVSKEREEKKEKREWQKRKKEGLEKLKTLTDYEKEARYWFQKWIRERDKGLPCISCGRIADRYDAGHYLPAELYSGLIFNEDNVNNQCSRPCNLDLHGNLINYRIGLIKKIGEERVKWLEENKDRLRVYQYTKEQLLEIKKEYQLKYKELKNDINRLRRNKTLVSRFPTGAKRP